MKGFLGGVSIGAVVAVAGAAMWSLSTPLPARIQVGTETPGHSDRPTGDEARPLIDGQNRDPDLVDALPSSPAGSLEGDVSPNIAAVDTQPGQRPVIGTASGATEGDTSVGEVITRSVAQTTKPRAAQPSGEVLQAPGEESDLEVSTETAALPEPVQPESDARSTSTPTSRTSEAETALVESELNTQSQSGQISTPSVLATAAAPQIGRAPAATAVPNIAPPATPARSVGDPDEDENTDANTASTSVAKAQAIAPGDTTSNESSNAGTAVVTLPTTEADSLDSGPQIGTRVVPLTERENDNETVTSARSVAVTTGARDSENADQPPFEANAQAFEAVADRPLMSIVLIDDEAAIGAEALVEFPYALTFAIDPADPNAIEKMQQRRAAGFEVLILADLPREAAPQDAETALAVWMERLPLAVGFLEGVETGFQGNRPLADQMVAAMAAAGYGMVTQNSGLNTVQKLALRDGMPAGVVFRDFDGAGQNPRAIRRFLDQAAFRARQEGAVIMLGRLRPETISALLLWGLQDRASQVGLSPVSAALRANLTLNE